MQSLTCRGIGERERQPTHIPTPFGAAQLTAVKVDRRLIAARTLRQIDRRVQNLGVVVEAQQLAHKAQVLGRFLHVLPIKPR